jgi:hypothetical protein
MKEAIALAFSFFASASFILASPPPLGFIKP